MKVTINVGVIDIVSLIIFGTTVAILFYCWYTTWLGADYKLSQKLKDTWFTWFPPRTVWLDKFNRR